jgi:tetratricopeptide (TPR) repeat protein/serine/threonine protein kinase
MATSARDLKAVFDKALELDSPTERARYLAEACGGDTGLRAEVESLLQALGQAGSFLEAPALAPGQSVDQPTTEEGPGTVIGPYKLIESIGEGGMGSVWMAQQQEPVKRLVALKLIKAGMDSKQIIARFEAERQALALMDHPNIARVLDGGTTASGRPYFVMDLVKGMPITRYCDEHHLTPRQRLELFVGVCQAVQHAHQKGIIHRDLKPSNVLVALYDGLAVPKVIDFGVAKAAGQSLTDKTLFTGFGAIVGTLEYMSPEQAELNNQDIDTRSDIYSLGVLLYELLTGTTPFSRKDLDIGGVLEMLRVIREQEPTRPSTKLSTAEGLPTLAANRGTEPAKLTRLVRGELDLIVMKALEKDRNRRYETANGFAMDVQRYLADEPVLACPPSAWYRLRKFARRNKRGLAVAGLVLGFLVILGAGAGWALHDRAAREQEVAQESARKRALAEEGIRQALDRAGNSLSALHAGMKKPGGVRELLNQPARWELFLRTAQMELTQARRLLAGVEGKLDPEGTRALARLEQALIGDEADYRLARRLEKIRLDRATWVKDSFDFRTAAEEYPKAFAGFEILTRSPETAAAALAASPIKEQLVAALDDWAWVAYYRLKRKDLLVQLLAVARRVGTDAAWGDRLRQLEVWDNREAVARLAAEAPAAGLSPQFSELVARLLGRDKPLKVAWLRKAQAQHPADFWLALELGNAISETEPAEAALWFRVALAIRPTNPAASGNLGNALWRQKKLPEAIAAYQKALELEPNHAWAHNGLGLVFANQRRFEEAIAAYHKAIKFAPKRSEIYVNLGSALTAQRKLDEAVAAYGTAIELDGRDAVAYAALSQARLFQNKLEDAVAACRKAIDIDPKYAAGWCSLGLAHHAQRKLPEAADAYRQAIALNPKDVIAYNNLGNVLRDQEKLEAAVAAYQKAIELEPKAAGQHHNLGIVLRLQGKFDLAVAAFHKAIELEPKDAKAYSELSIVLRLQGKLPQAVAACLKAIDIDPEYAAGWCSLGLAHHAQRKLPEAIACYRKAIALDPKLANAHYNLGNALRDQQQLAEAEAAYRKAIGLRPEFPEAHCNLGLILWNLGQFAQALEFLQKGHELGRQQPGWSYPSGRWVKDCERLLALDRKLPAVLAGKAAGPAEQLSLADLCVRYKKRYADAALLYGKAFATEPSLAESRHNAHGYTAALAAVLAAGGKGIGADKLDATARAGLRGQALDWLRAVLTARAKLVTNNPAAAGPVQKALQHWLDTPDLSGVRDAKELAELPDEERQRWLKLWGEVRDLARRARKK